MGSASKAGVPITRAVALVAKTLHSHDNERARWRAVAARTAADSGRNSPLGAQLAPKESLRNRRYAQTPGGATAHSDSRLLPANDGLQYSRPITLESRAFVR
jgi:hypothetical protein